MVSEYNLQYNLDNHIIYYTDAAVYNLLQFIVKVIKNSSRYISVTDKIVPRVMTQSCWKLHTVETSVTIGECGICI